MPPDPPTAGLLDCAVAAAHAAGRHAMAHLHRRTDAVRVARNDVKLVLDVECQARAEAIIRRAHPGHAILGEEGRSTTPRGARAAYEWVIDPIDGTVNFSHGLRFWCSSVAVRSRRGVLAGAVFAPQLDETFTATADGPARLNGVPIRVSAVDTLSLAIVFTGHDKNVTPGRRSFSLYERIAASVQRARIMGSAALDMCNVACGRADGYFESGIYIWDVAAAGLIVRRAGGRAQVLRRLSGSRLMFLATNGRIHGPLKDRLLR